MQTHNAPYAYTYLTAYCRNQKQPQNQRTEKAKPWAKVIIMRFLRVEFLTFDNFFGHKDLAVKDFQNIHALW